MTHRHSWFIAAAAASLAVCLAACSHQTDNRQAFEKSFAKVAEGFNDPDKQFRPAPLWVWNTNVTTDDIDRMLTAMKEKGFGGAFVHPRPGLVTEYLSKEWFDMWRYSVEKGKELGLDIWIYDENSYPSGFAGGHVPDQMPESYNQGCGLSSARSDKAPAPDGCVLCLKRDGDTFTDITANLADYQDVPGDYYTYSKIFQAPTAWNAGFPYVDLLVKGVTEKFIEVTMEGYEKEFGSELGSIVKGTFTDEPNIRVPGPGCRWTPDLFDEFQKRWGYDLKTSWPLLEEEIGDWKKVRHDYQATLLQMYIDRWSKPWYEYTEKKGMYWTGHYWEHEWPQMFSGPDNMAMYAWHQLPAVDMLTNTFDDYSPYAQFGNVRSIKELRSVANQKGYVRTLSETYGAGGWNVTFADFKRMGDWEYALGVNFMNQHLCHMTITGVRKNDYPPVFTSVSPWWDSYKMMNDYFGRLSLVLSQGEQKNDIIIMEPTTSLWLYDSATSKNKRYDIGVNFQVFITALEKAQLEYDLGSEDIIRNCGSVSKKGLTVGKRTYSTFVIPPMTENLEASTFALLKKFVKAGGTVIAYSSPSFVDGAESEELKEFMSGSNGIKFMNEGSELLAYASESSEFALKVSEGSGLYHHRRIYDDGQLLFIANSSMEKEAGVEVKIEGKYLYRLDAITGEIFLESTSETGLEPFELMLPPAGSALWFASDEPVFEDAVKAKEMPEETTEIQRNGDFTVRFLKPNVLNLDFCDLKVEGKEYGSLYTIEACRRLFAHFGMADPWESAVQFKSEVIQKDTMSRGETFVDYSFTVGKGTSVADMTAFVERPDIWEVSINGVKVTSTGPSFLDTRTGTFPIGEYVHEGLNTITLHLPAMRMLAEIAPVILQGSFSVKGAERGFTLAPEPAVVTTGSWAEQGYPFYSWDATYSAEFDIDDATGTFIVEPGPWNGTVCSVKVNGEDAGRIAFPPYKLDVSPLIKEGKNTVEVTVTGSMRNLYGPHYSDSAGIVGPGNWNGVTAQSPGADYRFDSYGLTEGFKLTR